MSHEHETILFTPEFWDERYLTATQIWSGNPNSRLVEQVANLAPGSALDVGCGEGADAIWLAEQGWQVTGVDVSTVALQRAAERAAAAGDAVAERTSWQQVDVLTWDPFPAQFDLVSAQFMQLPPPSLESVHRRLAAAVRPGGSLLIVGHHPADLHASDGGPDRHELMFTAEQVAAALDAEEWTIVVTATLPRQRTDPDGQTRTIHDAVLHAVRRAPSGQ
jgi:SAM-dependent methyltransferase